jgi:nitrogen fixation-related uncharacterized protein
MTEPAPVPVWLTRLVIPGLIGIIFTLIGTIWAMQSGQMGDLKLDIQRQTADLRSDIRNLQTKNDDLVKSMNVQNGRLGDLTQRVTDLLDVINRGGQKR